MIERIDESKELSLKEVEKLKGRMNLLRKVSLFVLFPVLGYFLLLIFTPLKNFLGSWPYYLFSISFLSWYASHALKFVKAWENASLFRLGKWIKDFKPGLRFMLYPIEKVIFVKMWEREIDLPEQSVDTREGRSKIDIRMFFRVEGAGEFLTAAENPVDMAVGKARGDVTTAAGSMTIDDLLMKREELATNIKDSLNKGVRNWGMVFTQIRLDNLQVPEDVLKAREGLAKAEVDKKTVIVNADAQLYKAQQEAAAEKAKLVAKAEGEAREFELKVKALGPDGAGFLTATMIAAAIKPSDKIVVQGFQDLISLFGGVLKK